MSPLMTRKLNGRVHEEGGRNGGWRAKGKNFTTMIGECQGNLKEGEKKLGREFNFSVIEG